MKKNVAAAVLFSLALFGFAVNVQAYQDAFKRPEGEQKIEKVRERIETLRMWKLTKALDLDEKTSVKVFPLLNRYDRERADLEIGLRKDMKGLRESLKDMKAGELKPLLERLEQNHKSLQTTNVEEWLELKKILTIEQQAKYIIFKLEFEREMRQVIEDARDRRSERPGKQRPDRARPPEQP